MGAGGSSGNPRSKTHQYLENAATAIPLLLKRQSASECRVIAERLGQLKEEVEYIALSIYCSLLDYGGLHSSA